MQRVTTGFIPADMCLPCSGPRFAAWPLSQDNPPRRVDHLTAHGCAVLEPCPGWRTYARTMDLMVVTPEELREYTAAGNCMLGCPVINNAPGGEGSDS
jgi:hypothetical protein